MAIYLLVTLPKAIRRFKESRLQSNSLFRAYYFVLWIALIMRIGRSIFWWFKFRRDVDADEKSLANIPWIILRGTIWMVEISLLVCDNFPIQAPLKLSLTEFVFCFPLSL